MKWLKKKIQPYIDELAKVEWPSWDELQVNTVTVLVASLLLAIVVAIMDFVFQQVMTFLYQLFIT